MICVRRSSSATFFPSHVHAQMSKRNASFNRYSPIIQRKPYARPSCSSKRAFSTQRVALPSASIRRTFSSLKPTSPHFPSFLLVRCISTSESITAVNAPRSTPLTFRKLDQALIGLEKDAAVYVNTSQLRLALRGLESENPVTRVASRLKHMNSLFRFVLTR